MTIYHKGDTLKVEVKPWGTDRINITVPCCHRDVHPFRWMYDQQFFDNGVPVSCPGCRWTWHIKKISDTEATLIC